MSAVILFLDICATTGTIYFASNLISHSLKNKSLPLPPGSKPRYLIGNFLDLPNAPDGGFWAKHKDLYGIQIVFLILSRAWLIDTLCRAY